MLIHRKESVTDQLGKQLYPNTSISHDRNMHDSMTQDSDTFMKMSHDAGIQASQHNRMIIEKSQTDPVKSRNKEVTLNSCGPIRMETDDKQSAVEIVIPICDVVFENIDLAACLRPLVSCLSLKIALSVVDSSLLFIKDICRNVGPSRPFVQLLAFLVLGFLRDLGVEPAAIKNIVFVDSLEMKESFEVSDSSLVNELICPISW